MQLFAMTAQQSVDFCHASQVGNKFVINCLEEGSYSTNTKHFLKRFLPNTNCLDAIAWSPAKNRSTLSESGIVAYMECKVVSRMEIADHCSADAQGTDKAIVNSDKMPFTEDR